MERTILTTLTPDELRQIVVESVRHCLKSEKPAPDNTPAPEATPFITKREAARLISVCQSTIDNYARSKHLTRHYVGKSVRFDRRQVLSLAQKHANYKQKTN